VISTPPFQNLQVKIPEYLFDGGLLDASGLAAYWRGETLPEVSTGQNVVSVLLSDASPTFRGVAQTVLWLQAG
jgi:hypothetical protein